jgi:Flp pilus assembly protein CpaB
MSRRGRALGFGALALLSAVLAAVLANGYGSSVARSFGPLRPVVVAAADLPQGKPIVAAQLAHDLQVRRVPERFAPSGALAVPADALGRVPEATVPAGSYLLGAQLGLPRPPRRKAPGLAGGKRPVEIAVSAAEALLEGGGGQRGSRVDVIVTTEPRGPGPGRTYVAAADVRLLALRRAAAPGPGPAGGWNATLALSRRQALELIEAENFARQVRLLPRP